VLQAVDVDALHAEGLDLDLVDRMKDLAVVGDDESKAAGQTDVLAAFDRSAPSTKVVLCSSVSFLACNSICIAHRRVYTPLMRSRH